MRKKNVSQTNGKGSREGILVAYADSKAQNLSLQVQICLPRKKKNGFLYIYLQIIAIRESGNLGETKEKLGRGGQKRSAK